MITQTAVGRMGSAALSIGILVSAAGCGQSSTNTSKAQSKGQLIFYSAQGYDASEAAAFQKATGIQVKLTDMSTGPLIAKVEAEQSSPKWDVMWIDGDGPMYALDQQNLLLRGWLPKANYTDVGTSLIPADHSYYPTGVSAAGAIVYNTSKVSANQAPTTWTDLLKPAFHGLVGLNDPAVAGPAYPFVAGLFYQMGTVQAEAYFSKLKANGLQLFTSGPVEMNGLKTGALAAALPQDLKGTAGIAEGSPFKVVYPSTGVTLMPSVIAINTKAPDMANAKRFVEFVLSHKGQQIMIDPNQGGSDSYFEPVIQGEKADPGVPQSGVVWIRVPANWQADHLTEIQNWFRDNISQ